MALPCLPGLSFGPNIGRENFLRPQRFTFRGKERHEQVGTVHSSFSSCAKSRIQPLIDKSAHAVLDKRVLCFYAHLLQPVYLVSPNETYRIRKFRIHYFLADDTMEVYEPRQKNSAMLQGMLFRRHKFKKRSISSKRDAEYYTLFDLNVDVNLDIYGFLFKITNCDLFTRKFLTEIGISVNEPVADPVDPYDKQRKTIDDVAGGRFPYFREKDKLGPFLKYNGMILKFHCLWKEIDILGTVRKMKLHYFLDDGTMEIIEERSPNSGRNDTNVFLKRSLLPKHPYHLPKPWERTEKKILALGGTAANSGHYCLDTNPLQENLVETEYFTDKDFDIGQEINVYGRSFFIYDCDQFTREFYRQKYGKQLKSSVPIPENMKPVHDRAVLPVESVGTHEETLLNCVSMQPKFQDKKWPAYFAKDRYGWKGGELKFTASLLSENHIQRTRKFVITYYLADDTLMVNEPNQINSGICDGKFVSRSKIIKRIKTSLRPLTEPKYYVVEDMFVGNVLHIFNHDFIITGANEATFDYLEENCNVSSCANFSKILRNIKNGLRTQSHRLRLYFHATDTGRTGSVSFDVFRKAILEAMPEDIPEHEIITLARHYAHLEDISMPLEHLVSTAQTELRKRNFRDFKELTLALKAYDLECTGYFTKEQLYRYLRGCNIPLKSDTLKPLINNFPTSDNGYIEYMDFLITLDFFNNPTQLSSPKPCAIDINWIHKFKTKSLDKINYEEFLEDLSS